MDLGVLHLLPVPLAEGPATAVFPPDVMEKASHLRHWIVETPKAARAHLKVLAPHVPISEHHLRPLDKHKPERNVADFLKPCLEGHDMGLISDAGVPGVADPGSKVIEAAHAMGIRVLPWVGPSSILLGLMASGFNGQQFQFVGYLPHDQSERKKQWSAMERSVRQGQTQIFIETPYRNQKVLEEALQSLGPDLHFCIACDLSGPEEYVRSRSVQDWKKDRNRPNIHKRPAIFLIGRSNRIL
ncbi:MAG: SAM-dependent methyltransferase [Schleiferiaceae bacterium]|nr:SAM-dependent methyltransferase [Schleiferiaceae bacterium]